MTVSENNHYADPPAKVQAGSVETVTRNLPRCAERRQSLYYFTYGQLPATFQEFDVAVEVPLRAPCARG